MRIKPVFIFVVLLLASAVTEAAPKIQTWETENGAKVFFVAAPELPMVDIQVVFDGGGARDGEKPGLALMTNALLAEGAGELSDHQISEKFEALGAQFSNSSHRDMAVVSLRSLSDKHILDPSIALLNTVLSKPTFPKNAFERERSRLMVGLEQRKQSPGDLADEAFFKAVYQEHPYAHLPDGSKETVEKLTVADLKNFYKQYYVSKNAVVAIVGNLDRKQAEQVVKATLKDLPQGEHAPKLAEVPPISAAKDITIDHPSAQTHILMGAPGMKRGDKDYFELYVGNHILGGSGLVSRLSAEIRENRGLSYSTYSHFAPMRKEGPYIMGLQTKNDSAKEALKVLREQLQKYVNEGPTAEELEAAKKNITGGFPLRISSNSKIVGYIAMIGFYELPLDYLDKFNDNINAVTTESVKDAFQRRVQPEKMVTVLVGGQPS